MTTFQIAAVVIVIAVLGWPIVKSVFRWGRNPAKPDGEEILMQVISLRKRLLADSDAIEAIDKVLIPSCIAQMSGTDHDGVSS